jgi:hypothetical protein
VAKEIPEGQRALPAAGQTSGNIPALLDTNVLSQAFRGDRAALAEVRASGKRITSGVYQEFLSGQTPVDRVGRKAFLEREGITKYTKTESEVIRQNPIVEFVSDAIKNAVDQTKPQSKPHSKADQYLAGFAKATG